MTQATDNSDKLYGKSTSMTAEQIERLSQLVPKIELKDRPGPGNSKLFYIDQDYVSEVLDTIFGPDGWSFQIREIVKQHADNVTMTKWENVNGKSTQVTVSGASVTATCIGTLTIRLWREGFGERVFTRDGVGGATNALAEPEKGTSYGDMLENVFKSAETDALKRAARKLGYATGRNIDKNGQTRVSNLEQGAQDTNVAGQGHGRTTVPPSTQAAKPAAGKPEPAKPADKPKAETPAAGNQKADAKQPTPDSPPAGTAKAPEKDEKDPWDTNLNGTGGSPLPAEAEPAKATGPTRPPTLTEDDDFDKIKNNEQWTRFFRVLQTDYIQNKVKPIDEAVYRLQMASKHYPNPIVAEWHNVLLARLKARVEQMDADDVTKAMLEQMTALVIPKGASRAAG